MRRRSLVYRFLPVWIALAGVAVMSGVAYMLNS